jgi:hypothetical protein
MSDVLPADIAPRRALVCALDWGLGHVARTTPLVRELLSRGCEVVLASNGRSADWWRMEFPHLELRELPDYGVRYVSGPLLVPSLLLSLPRLRSAIRAEAGLVASWRPGNFDLVLSDSRFGCAMRGVRSVFLTHQLRPAPPLGLGIAESLGERSMAGLVRAFSEIWIPDRESGRILSGRLGHPRRPSGFPPLRYLGPLSRFSATRPDPLWSGPWTTVGIVSGPEPTRTDLEALLRHLFSRRPGRHLLVRGRPDLPPSPVPGDGNVVESAHLASPALAAALLGATEIVTRGGYSTVMDLEALGLLGPRCLFVPTPGQTEQEAVARNLAARGLARNLRQRDLRGLA